jgi:hypothetical protein
MEAWAGCLMSLDLPAWVVRPWWVDLRSTYHDLEKHTTHCIYKVKGTWKSICSHGFAQRDSSLLFDIF